MKCSFTQFFVISCFITLFTITVVTPSAALPSGDETSATFEVRIISTAIMKILNTERKIDADTFFRYTWTQNGNEKVLKINAAHVKTQQDGQELMNTFMSREKFIDIKNGKKNEIAYEEGREELKTVLRESFDTPLCKLVTDKNGEERVTIITKPGAKGLLDNGIIANALLFHSRFPTDKNQWQSTREISMGNGGFAKGTLTYIKQARDRTRQTLVKVSGIFTKDAFKLPDSPLRIKNARYVVNGSQTYDTARGEWVSGKLSFKISFQMTNNELPLATAEGNMQITLKMIASR